MTANVPEYILREDIFPLTCKNKSCKKEYEIPDLHNYLQNRGLIFNEHRGLLYIGITCPHCCSPSIWIFSLNKTPIDLRYFILQPTRSYNHKLNDKLHELENKKRELPYLRFETIHRWTPDFDELKIQDELEYDDPIFDDYLTCKEPPLVIETNAEEERITGMTKLRRLYLKDSIFFHFFEIFESSDACDRSAGGYFKFFQDEFITSKNTRFNEAILMLAEYSTGHCYKDIVKKSINEKDPRDFSFEKFEEIIELQKTKKLYKQPHPYDLEKFTKNINWEDQLKDWKGWKTSYDYFLKQTLLALSLDRKREELSKWTKSYQKGKALFVNAPMGLGKSYSIRQFFIEKPNASAVVFFPTKALCMENAVSIYWQLTQRPSLFELPPGYASTYYKEHLPMIINHGPPNILLIDGINKDECCNFDEISERYHDKWFIKKDICNRCDQKQNCRFYRWPYEINKTRIIVTTHAQYEFFLGNKKLHTWRQPPVRGNKHQSLPRDLFIIDEDLILNNCFAPKPVTFKDLKDSINVLSNIVNKHEKSPRSAKSLINKLDSLLGKISRIDKSAVVCPIDKTFRLPQKVRNQAQNFKEQKNYIPLYTNLSTVPPNLSDEIEHAIRYGAAIQKYPISSDTGENKQNIVFNIFLPNPKTYDLKNAPPHVFFDGTLINHKYLRRKIKGVKLETVTIDFKPITQCRVFQNTNTDLATNKIDFEKVAIKQFVEDVVAHVPLSSNIFVHSTKAIYDKCLSEIVARDDKDFVRGLLKANYYGNMRGHNDFEGYNYHIMLGAFNPPDAYEIAMSLEFIQNQLKQYDILTNYPEMWTWKESNSLRTYIKEFDTINKISAIIRYSEQRQALARTRPLFNDVTFFIVAKEPVSKYVSYLSKIENRQYRADLFPPRKIHLNTKYSEVKTAIIDFLGQKKDYEQKSFCDMDIVRQTGINRATVKKHRNSLMEEGFIKTERGRKTKYKLVNKQEQVK